jgi:hypothetical protein
MAALLLGRLLTRPDMGAALEDFLVWCEQALRTVDDLSAPFLMPGGWVREELAELDWMGEELGARAELLRGFDFDGLFGSSKHTGGLLMAF